MENKELDLVDKKIKGMQAMIDATQVTNDEELAEISDKIKHVKDMGKYVKGLKDELTAPAKTIIDRAKMLFDGPIKECTNAEEILKGKAQKYLLAKETARAKAEKKIEDDLATGKIKKTETAVRRMEALPEEQRDIKTGASGLRMTRRRVAEIKDPGLIPDEYWIVDEVRVRKEALERDRNGQEPIPGIIIKEEVTMSSI